MKERILARSKIDNKNRFVVSDHIISYWEVDGGVDFEAVNNGWFFYKGSLTQFEQAIGTWRNH